MSGLKVRKVSLKACDSVPAMCEQPGWYRTSEFAMFVTQFLQANNKSQ